MPVQASIGPGVSRSLRFSVFSDNRHIKVGRFAALSIGRLHPQGRFLIVLIEEVTAIVDYATERFQPALLYLYRTSTGKTVSTELSVDSV